MLRRGFIAAAVALAVAACTIAAIGVITLAHPVAASKPSAAIPVRHSAVTLPGIRTCKNPVSPIITSVKVPGSTLIAEELTYRWNGNVAVEKIPPIGWKAATASNAELKFFGIGAKPTHGRALAAWTDEWVTRHSTITAATPCADKLGVSAGASVSTVSIEH
jgi:hypothetical protein